jgi:hypothetical protein
VAVETAQADVAAQRNEWIEARVSEFANDPAMRDRAIATILCDFMLMSESFQTLAGAVQKEGLGGLMKAVGGGLLGRKNGKA